VDVLQHDVATYIDNTKPGVPVSQQRSGRAIKSISQRLKVGFLKNCNAIIESCVGISVCKTDVLLVAVVCQSAAQGGLSHSVA
jgi:hypothetical protein